MGRVIMLVTTKMALFFSGLFFTWFNFLKKCVFRLKDMCSPMLSIRPRKDDQHDENKLEQEKKDDEDVSESSVWFRFRTYDEYMERNREQVKDEATDHHQPVTCEDGLKEKSKTNECNDDDVNFNWKKDETTNGTSTDVDSFPSKDLLKPRVCRLGAEPRFRKKTVRFADVTVASESVDNSTNVVHFSNDQGHYAISDSDSDSDLESLVSSSSTKSSLKTSLADSNSDGFLSDIDFVKAFEFDVSKDQDNTPKQHPQPQNLSTAEEYNVSDWVDDDDEEADDATSQENKHYDNDEKTNLEPDDQNDEELEKQWEHQDLVEQLKMEIKKVKAIGLPTIFEECESPEISEELKTWKINEEIEKFEHERKLDELQKMYKSYKGRMRMLDILNYQKMYAIGFLQRKRSVESITKRNISPQTMATIVSVDCWPCKSKCATEIQQPVMKKLNRELESELEKVYVGQMCLSWDFLCLQYNKALELWDSDPHGICQYNQVGERFRQFQILLARFLEDEPYHGPRVQHYVKTRCVVRYLLHVPVIRDDDAKDKTGDQRQMARSKNGVTIVKLVELIEESIRIFWKFIRLDKDTSITLLLKCRRVSNTELQNPGDANLFAQVRSILLKKEKKLKEVLRSESCILRKFQNQGGDDNVTDHVLYFFSHVDLRLVQRVLNMSKITTDQLVWCKSKLNNIHFVDKKLLVEPSITLFPAS